VSGVHAEKTGDALGAYNAASDSAAALARLWNMRAGDECRHLADVFSRGPEAPDRLARLIRERQFEDWDSALLERRLAHFRLEFEEVVPGVAGALARGDLATLGSVVDRSQAGAEQLLRNQVPETVLLAAKARKLGAVAASAFGAGFGGAVWALVEEDRAEAFRVEWSEAYLARFPSRARGARFLLERAGPPAFSLTFADFWP
jgi:galactokinase